MPNDDSESAQKTETTSSSAIQQQKDDAWFKAVQLLAGSAAWLAASSGIIIANRWIMLELQVGSESKPHMPVAFDMCVQFNFGNGFRNRVLSDAMHHVVDQTPHSVLHSIMQWPYPIAVAAMGMAVSGFFGFIWCDILKMVPPVAGMNSQFYFFKARNG